tara:strand:- start:66 stop:296 length:231 start_codon:yes stop_codon:yes gene_type:complete
LELAFVVKVFPIIDTTEEEEEANPLVFDDDDTFAVVVVVVVAIIIIIVLSFFLSLWSCSRVKEVFGVERVHEAYRS